jgi:hypothetical protein
MEASDVYILKQASCTVSLNPRKLTVCSGYAPGASMRQEVYRVAFDEANAELSEILGKFEQLRIRKDRVEKVVEALKPLVASEAATVASDLKHEPAERPHEVPTLHATSESAQSAPSPIPYPVQQPAMAPSDPFARRESGSAPKDVSEYSRLFNTGTSRS